METTNDSSKLENGSSVTIDGIKYTFIEELKYPVYGPNHAVKFPAGTKNVLVGFRQAKWSYTAKDGKQVKGNLYKLLSEATNGKQ